MIDQIMHMYANNRQQRSYTIGEYYYNLYVSIYIDIEYMYICTSTNDTLDSPLQ